MLSSRFVVGAIVVGALSVCLGTVNAETLLVDFGATPSFRGVSAPNPDANGHFWNSLTPGPFFPGLIDITGASTTVALGFDTPVGTDSFNGPAGVTSFPNPTAAEIAATAEYALARSKNATWMRKDL